MPTVRAAGLRGAVRMSQSRRLSEYCLTVLLHLAALASDAARDLLPIGALIVAAAPGLEGHRGVMCLGERDTETRPDPHEDRVIQFPRRTPRRAHVGRGMLLALALWVVIILVGYLAMRAMAAR